MTYSKKLPVITGIIFILTIIYCLCFGNGFNDGTVYVTAITATAAAFTGTIIWYLKKAQAENMYKLDMSCYKEKAKIEIDHIEAIIKIKQKYNVSDYDIEEIKSQSDLDDMTRDSFQKIINNIEEAQADAHGEASDFQ